MQLRETGLGGTMDDVDLHALADRWSTPLYVYCADSIRTRIDELQDALSGLDSLVCYAAKANSNMAILGLMAEAGVGADIVSVGELRRCLRAGIPAERVVFSGVGKTGAEMVEALDAGIWKFNVESADELLTLQEVAQARDAIARAAVRINPDVDARTHGKISTGKSENKFGVSIAEAQRWFAGAPGLPNVRLTGLHVHIGSQILSPEPFRLAFERTAQFWRELAGSGHVIDSIDVGGGLGVCYRAGRDVPIQVADYVAEIRAAFDGFKGRIVLEPGRHLVAEAGLLLTRVIRVKQTESRAFLIVDAAMNDLLRPSLYDAWHDVVALHGEPRPPTSYDIVGPVCETSDAFGTDRVLPECRAGDLLAIKGAGAYGASMASTYNSRPLPAELLLDDGRYSVVRRRQAHAEMVAGERLARSWETA
jgi:diaminopimelate decarboxylase